MSEEDNKQTTDETDKTHVKDLEPEKDPKGGGGLKPQSPGTGGTQIQPIPGQDS